MKTKQSTDELDSIEGFEGQITESLAKFMKFRVNVVEYFNSLDKKDEHGAWSGIIGALINGINLPIDP